VIDAVPPAPASASGFGGSPHFTSVAQLDLPTVERIFSVADYLQPIARRQWTTRVLEGAVLANLFFEASTRTRLSFGAAFSRLGGSIIDTTGFTFSSMAKGESIADTSRVISGYADAIVVRHPDEGSVAQFAEATNVPVVNGGDGAGEHPTQALLDAYTIQREFGRLGKGIDGSRIAVLGDLRYGRTVHSLLRLLSLYRGLSFALFSPAGLELPASVAEHARAHGHRVESVASIADALAGADVVYTTRIQKERIPEGQAVELSPDWQLRRELLDAHSPADVIVLHPLPRDAREGAYDLSTDLDGDPRLAIFRQTDNGVAVRMAVFTELLGVSHLVADTLRPAAWSTPSPLRPDDPAL